jgi:hypothetical protein
MLIQPLPPAPIRETDAGGNWINREEFRRGVDALLCTITPLPFAMRALADAFRSVTIVSGSYAKTIKCNARSLHIRAKAQRRERRVRT